MSPRFDELRGDDDNDAGIGFAFLGIEQVFYSIAVILIGVILGWATGLNKSADVVGAVSSFFGYLGFDAMACVAGEAINAERNLLFSIMITLAIVTTLYVAAAAAAAAAVAAAAAAINQECLGFMPSRHYAAYIVGLFPCVYDWVNNVWMMKCNKGCGWNTSHSTRSVGPSSCPPDSWGERRRPDTEPGEQFSSRAPSFGSGRVSSSIGYWGHYGGQVARSPSSPSSATGSTIPSAGSSDESHSTTSDRMISQGN
jgi:hypothetical protein